MATEAHLRRYLVRIEEALRAAEQVVCQFAPGTFQVRDRGGRDVVTEVDRRVSIVLRDQLQLRGEGWLSEEDPDDRARLACETVWVVDPLDGTREFVDGIPEWCISVGLVDNGVPVAGGTLNPATGELFLGALGCGVSHNGAATQPRQQTSLERAVILASRSEYTRGEWKYVCDRGLSVRPMGSVAYKLSRVAAGLADATWTLSPKHEWDVAAGVALMQASGQWAVGLDGGVLRFNQPNALLPGVLAGSISLAPAITEMVQQLQAPR